MKKKINLLLIAGLLLSFFGTINILADTSDATLKKQPPATEQKTEELKPSKYTIVTENFPPFNYIDKKGKLVGISTEIVQEILNRLNMKDTPISVMDWDKAYQIALEKPNTIIYSLTRIKSRENKFKWVGPIATNYWYLLSKKQPVTEKKIDKISVRNLKEAKNYSIGVQSQGAIYLYLKDKGFTNLVTTASNSESAKNLLDGKVQLWGESELAAASLLRQQNKNPNILQKTFKLRKHNLYIAFNAETSDSLVAKFQKILEQMKNDGTYDKIVNKYYNQIYIESVKEGTISNTNNDKYTLNN